MGVGAQNTIKFTFSFEFALISFDRDAGLSSGLRHWSSAVLSSLRSHLHVSAVFAIIEVNGLGFHLGRLGTRQARGSVHSFDLSGCQCYCH